MRELAIVAGAHLLAVASPGPDFAVVLKSSLSNGRVAAIYTALGVALGITVHVAYSIVGLAVLVSKSILLFQTIKYLGAAYLIYLGINALRSSIPATLDETSTSDSKSNFAAARQGFWTNVLNPKATLFFLSLFTQVIDTDTQIWLKVLYGAEMTVATFVWFGFVAIFMGQERIRSAYKRLGARIDKVFGAVLVGLGLRIATS